MTQSLRGQGAGGGSYNSWLNVGAGLTDVEVVPAAPGRKIVVTGWLANGADVGTSTFTFNSKGAGAGTAISPALKAPAAGGFAMANSTGWFETNPGEALTITTAGASAVGLIVVFRLAG